MFKRLARSPVIPFIVGTLIWAYMSLLARTMRWRVEGVDNLRKPWESGQGWMIVTWHSRLVLMPAVKIIYGPKWAKPPRPPTLMVSNSRDGEFTNRAATLLGMGVVRGSAPTKGKGKTEGKRGFMGAKDAMQVMKTGGGMAITIDGPKGPPEVVGLGAIKLAQQVSAPIIIYGLSANAKRMNSWDRLLFPWPFARGAMVIGEAIPTSKDMDSEALRLEVETKLKAAIARADELAGLAPDTVVPPTPHAPATPAEPIADAQPTAAMEHGGS